MNYPIHEIIAHLEAVAHPSLQESYDNSGLIIGHPDDSVQSVLLCLDVTETVVDEAIGKKCGLIIAHHPFIFKGLKRINGHNWVERTAIKAIRNHIAVYAIHTNLDNVLHQGVNSTIAKRLELIGCSILQPVKQRLLKLVTYVPTAHAENVRDALFDAGAGHIGKYDSCSFSSLGNGTFKAGDESNPFVGTKGELHTEEELSMEVVLPDHIQNKVLNALNKAHPYEEVAYELIRIENTNSHIGAGLIGKLKNPMEPDDFLAFLKDKMELQSIRYTPFKHLIKQVAVCGGSGSFLLPEALIKNADAFVSADFKYHQFFDAEERIMIADIGHYESEKYTVSLFKDILSEKMTNFAVLLSDTITNPIKYYV